MPEVKVEQRIKRTNAILDGAVSAASEHLALPERGVVEALEPFAIAEMQFEDLPDDHPIAVHTTAYPVREIMVTLADFRRARDVLAALSSPERSVGEDADMASRILDFDKCVATPDRERPVDEGLVERLRNHFDTPSPPGEQSLTRPLLNEAADYIEALSRPHPAVVEAAARLIERRMEQRFAEHGTREPDTNATYYEGPAAEIYEALDEEAEELAAAIRQLGASQ